MTKQEKIREEMANKVPKDCQSCESECVPLDNTDHCSEQYHIADLILFYLHSQGLVLKVDRELPEIKRNLKGLSPEEITTLIQIDMEVAGYVAVEPLIGGNYE